MKFRAYSSVLLTAVFLSAVSMPSQAATIAGTKCTKVGTAKTVSKAKYVCVKSGTKLIWKKGPVITATATPKPSVSATPTPTQSATPTPTQSATPTPTQSATPKASVSATPTSSQSATQSSSPSKSATPSASATTSLTKLTLEEVKKHDSGTSCWSIVYGNVFDLTKWITKHPGGAGVIRAICGKDGTSAFESQHAGEGRPANQLSNYYLGKLGDSVKL